MTSQLAAPPGLQAPSFWSAPPNWGSAGTEAIDLAEMAGLVLDPWQRFVLQHSLGERDGKWATFEVGVMVSRQNGKGGILEARELAGLFLFGERLIIHSAHQFDTSAEHFRRLLFLIEDTPELSRRVRNVWRSHGQEGIELTNGQRIRFRTRTSGGGRGFSADLVVLDECMDLPEAVVGALMPTLSARPNPQIWYTGSAVDQETMEHGVSFARIRERGHRGDDPSLAYFEWAAFEALSDVELSDPEGWAKANPALGIRISEDHVGKEFRSMPARKFAVERLGVGDWPATDDSADRVIQLADWAACVDQGSQILGPIAFAFDVTPMRDHASIAASGLRSDDLPHVEVIEHRKGVRWLPERMAELVERNPKSPVYCDPAGPAGSLIPALEQLGVEVTGVTAKEHGQACGIVADDISEHRLRHLGTQELAAAVDGARSRPLGESWAWSRKNSTADISPLVACTLARYGVSVRPRRKVPRIFAGAVD